MGKQGYCIRAAGPEEVALAVDWAAAEGWNPGLADAACYGMIDSGGFLVGLLEGEPIAVISAVRYGAGFGFIGFYIVRPDKRGQGWGLQLWNAAMAQLRGRIIGLDGVVDQQGNYRKSGFALAHRNVRYEGRGGRERRDGERGGQAAPEAGEIVPLSAVPFDQLAAYERPFFPEDRSAFLRAWIAQPGAVALGALRAGQPVGYGVCRPCRQGYKIGPLYADDAAIAERLFAALVADLPSGQPFYLDVPEVNPAAVALAEKHGMSVSFETARMYAGAAPDLPLERIFGVTSFEVG